MLNYQRIKQIKRIHFIKHGDYPTDSEVLQALGWLDAEEDHRTYDVIPGPLTRRRELYHMGTTLLCSNFSVQKESGYDQ